MFFFLIEWPNKINLNSILKPDIILKFKIKNNIREVTFYK
ncbi:hypothetical protein NARSGI1_01970 [endosymbiont of Sipalinus gigas]|nr:hypothetical protein NARSGI1_01970 [endosymbiont of Sipalinus gigas]